MNGRFRPSSSRGWVFFLVLLVLAAARYWSESHWEVETPPDTLAEGTYRVARDVDGDTLLLANHARVRLIGVDAPETVKPDHPVEPWGPEASAFTKEFIAGGEVRLTFDKERLDRFNRYLAYVWVGQRMLNEELVRAGLARVEDHFYYSPAMKTRFHRAQQEARAARRGIWSSSAVPLEAN